MNGGRHEEGTESKWRRDGGAELKKEFQGEVTKKASE